MSTFFINGGNDLPPGFSAQYHGTVDYHYNSSDSYYFGVSQYERVTISVSYTGYPTQNAATWRGGFITENPFVSELSPSIFWYGFELAYLSNPFSAPEHYILTITTEAISTNSPPTVTILAGSSYAAGTVLTGSQLFSVSDPQGTSDVNYVRVYDTNVTNGAVWKYNGSIITPGSSGYPVTYANLNLLTYTVGTGSNDFQVEAVDKSGAVSNDPVHTITGTSTNSPPTVTILAGSSYAAGTVLTGSQLFSVSDPQGISDINYVRVYDTNVTNGAVWKYNGSIITPGSSGYPVTYANLNLLTYTVGTGSNDFQVEAVDKSGAVGNDPLHTITGTSTNNRPDLTASNVTISDTTPDPGQAVNVNYFANNIGSGAASAFDAGVYLSTDSTITTADLFLGWESFASLAGHSSVNGNLSVTLPGWVVPGITYYVGVIADDLNNVSNELSESNNASYVAVTIPTVPEADILGTPGNDTFFANGGRSFTGNGGHDIVVFSGSSSEYTITRHADDSFTVVDGAGGRDGSDILSAIGTLQFGDKTIFIQDTDGANIARLYSAGLGRPPDPVGLFGWSDIYANNIPASAKAQGVYVALAQTNNGYGTSIAGGFTHSIEFNALYGALDNPGFVTQLYFNVLERAPEPAGLTGWLNLMQNGGFTREMVLVGFAQSPENIAKTASDWLIEI